MKQVSTPLSTSVRRSAWAPFTRVRPAGSSKTVPGLRMPAGSNAALMRRMSATFVGSSRAMKYFFFSVPMPCSPEMAPPRSMQVRKRSIITRGADLGVLLEDGEVHVAVAGVAAAGDPRPGAGGERR